MSVPILYAGSHYKPGKTVLIPVPVAPQFASAEVGNVNASTVAVTFDSAIVAAGSDYSTGVTIKVNGSAAAFESGIRQSNHAIVYYALSSAVLGGDLVTWEYSATAGAITGELYGLALPDVSAQSVANHVPLVLPRVASATLLRDWRASDFSGLPDDTPLNTWTSHDPGAHVLTRGAGSTNLITSKAGTTNNRYYVEFNTTDDWLLNQDSSDLDNLNSFAVFIAHDFTTIITKMNNTSNGAGWALYASGTSVIIQDAGGVHWIGKDSSSPFDFTGISTMEVVSKSELHVYSNNDNSTESNSSRPPVTNYSTSEPLRINTWGDFSNFVGGWVFGILIYSPAPSAADRALITQWMIDNELGLE